MTSRSYPPPVYLLVSSTVPVASRLFICRGSCWQLVASTLAFLAVNDKLEGVTKHALVEMAMENEKRVGVNDGGYVVHRCPASVVVY